MSSQPPRPDQAALDQIAGLLNTPLNRAGFSRAVRARRCFQPLPESRPVTMFFGRRWDAQLVETDTQYPTPVGESCFDCHEPILADECGLLFPPVEDGAPTLALHMECNLGMVLAHNFRQCSCYTQHATSRDRARAVLAAVNAERARQGLGPM